MIIAGLYSFKRGRETLEAQFAAELNEIEQIIRGIDAAACPTNVCAKIWDLQQRGEADIDIPVLILGVAAGETEDR